MSHDPESRTRQEIAAPDDSSFDPETPQQGGGPRTSEGSVDPDGTADHPHRQSHDPYQPL